MGERAAVESRSIYRLQFDETYRHRTTLNSFLIQVRSHELRHAKKEKMPICSRFFSPVSIKHSTKGICYSVDFVSLV